MTARELNQLLLTLPPRTELYRYPNGSWHARRFHDSPERIETHRGTIGEVLRAVHKKDKEEA